MLKQLYSSIKTNYDCFQLISYREESDESRRIIEKYNIFFNVIKMSHKQKCNKDEFLVDLFANYIIDSNVYEIDFNRLLIMYDEKMQDKYLSDITEQFLSFLDELWHNEKITELNVFSIGFASSGASVEIIESKAISEIKEVYLMRTWAHSLAENNFEYYPINNYIFVLRKQKNKII